MSTESTEQKSSGKNAKPPEVRQEPGLISEEGSEYEEQKTGIELSYSLKEEEIYACLKSVSHIRVNSKGFRLGMVALAVFAVVFLVIGVSANHPLFFFYAASCLTALLVLIFFPYQNNKMRAHAAADGHTIYMAVYPDHIQLGRGIKRWNIPLDGSVEYAQFDGMMVLYVPEKDDPKKKVGQRLVVLPIRCVKPKLLPEIQAMILSGTKPKK